MTYDKEKARARRLEKRRAEDERRRKAFENQIRAANEARAAEIERERVYREKEAEINCTLNTACRNASELLTDALLTERKNLQTAYLTSASSENVVHFSKDKCGATCVLLMHECEVVDEAVMKVCVFYLRGKEFHRCLGILLFGEVDIHALRDQYAAYRTDSVAVDAFSTLYYQERLPFVNGCATNTCKYDHNDAWMMVRHWGIKMIGFSHGRALIS